MPQIPPVVRNALIEMCDAYLRRKRTDGCRQSSQLYICPLLNYVTNLFAGRFKIWSAS